MEAPAPTADALATKRAALIERTKTLITGLRNVEKLADLTADTLSCGGHANGTADKKEETPPQNEQETPAPDGTDGTADADPNAP